MKAILIKEDQSLVWGEVPNPVIGADEALVKIEAAALNRADLMQRAGDYPPPAGCPEWMGLEIAGEIVKIGEEAARLSRWRIGDKVCALLGGGGYAEFASVRYDMMMPVPEGISIIEAAAMPEAFATAYLNLFYEGEAKAGETLLMHAGASGLASVVIPMAKAFGLRVITTVLTDSIAASITHLNADRIVVSGREDIALVLKEELEGGRGVDLAIDCLGGEDMARCLPYMARDGRWIMIATLAGDYSCVNLKELYKRSVRIIGNTLRARTPEMKAEILANLVDKVWPKVESGDVRATVYKTLPIQQAEEAHSILQRGENVGKVVLTVDHADLHE
ncbi:MAG: NAD(P)H-quinone oxidoreductase [Christensenellales bacterium]|jgi:NADPH2:quinone reductase